MIRESVASSSLAEVGFDAENQVLEVVFRNGAIYQYEGVPAEIHAGLMAAPSQGQFLDRFIKKAGFRYRRLA